MSIKASPRQYPWQTAFLDFGAQLGVDVAYDLFLADELFVTAKVVVDREDALHIQLGRGRLAHDAVDERQLSRDNGVGGEVMADVVDADEQENLGGMARGNAFEAVLDALDDVTADTAAFFFGPSCSSRTVPGLI